jgi:hypothetical protein
MDQVARKTLNEGKGFAFAEGGADHDVSGILYDDNDMPDLRPPKSMTNRDTEEIDINASRNRNEKTSME